MILIRLFFLPLRMLFYPWFKLRLLWGKKEVLVHSIPERFTMLQPSGWFSFLLPDTETSFVGYLIFLRMLEKSTELKEVIYCVPEISISWHQAEQISHALRKIARSGKKLTAHTNGGNLKTLYLMTPAQRRYAAPHANFLVLLPAFESYFVKEILDRLGISIETQSAGRYKGSGFESFTRKSFSPESRESMSTLIKGMRQELKESFEQTRGLSKPSQKNTLNLFKNQALLQAVDLTASGFLHKTVSDSRLAEFVLLKKEPASNTKAAHAFNGAAQNSAKSKKSQKKADQKAIEYALKRERAMKRIGNDGLIAKRFWRRNFPLLRLRRTPSLALVVMEGAINMGHAKEPPRSHNISALPFCELFQNLAQNRDEAVFLYINSPGGSADASELLFEKIYELSRIKPVFAFLGSVAASGGYYIACAANRIYASPLAITGSIGVIRIRPDLQKLYHKLGIRKESLFKDPTREIFSEAAKLSTQSQRLLRHNLKSTYDLFLQRVSLGRDKKNKELVKMAEGRVFTGRQFQKEGMIDGHFDFIEALTEYKKVCGIALKQEYNFHHYPELKTDIQSLLSTYARSRAAAQGYHLIPQDLNSKVEWILRHNTGRPLVYLPEEEALRNI